MVFVMPSLFIIPGAFLLAILRRNVNNITKLIVEGYFISTIVSVMLTSIMLMLGLPLISLNYSLAVFILVLPLSIIALRIKIEFKLSKPDILLVVVAFLAYVILIIYFSGLPRLFTPDETAYIFSARMGILNGVVPPMGVQPDANEVKSLFQGRYFWIYFLASFIGSTGLPAYQAGLLNVSFLIMTALASSLLVENKWESAAVFMAVILNPLLFSFSALTLNDLAISFYAVFVVSHFISSFSKINNNLTISIKNLFYSLLGIIVVIMIKPNIVVFIAMWIILVYIILRYKLYKHNLKYRILLITMVLPVLIYELCIDIPYVVSVWILKNSELGSIFRKFLFISPVEHLLGLFFTPWWKPTASTLFTRSFADYMDYLYRILMPESSSVLVSTIILVLPFFILLGSLPRKQDKNIHVLLIFLSLWLFYIDAVRSFSLSDASRYSLWMIPLWIPLSLMVLRDVRDNPSFSKFLVLFMGALILLWINIWLSREKGGVYVGYGLPLRLWTANAFMTQLILLLLILSLLFLEKDLLIILRLTIGRNLSVEKSVNLKNVALFLVIALILLSEVYFSSQFIEKSKLYENHGFNMISDALNGLEYNENLIFSNNYIYMRPYVNDKLFQQGLLLPLPDTKEEFLKLLEIAPNNTLLLISSDSDTTWYEYCNKYIKRYGNSDIITPEKSTFPILPKFNLTNPILKMTFDDANETTVVDHSGSGNNYALKIKEITLPTGVVKLYTISTQKNNPNLKEVLVKDLRLNIQKNLTVMLELQIDSLASKNVSILIATDRFTKIYNIPLNKGLNNVKFHFDYVVDPSWYEAGGFYWIHLAQTRVIVIENNTINYNRFITIQDLELMNILFLILLCGFLILYSIFSLERYDTLGIFLQIAKNLANYMFKKLLNTC
ncbi:MAG: hypothetical protein LM590_06305 [Thermofilum sp.]|nr:hypothetical protein [Thermofilum sp.]